MILEVNHVEDHANHRPYDQVPLAIQNVPS
jgi:hypothetical protein